MQKPSAQRNPKQQNSRKQKQKDIAASKNTNIWIKNNIETFQISLIYENCTYKDLICIFVFVCKMFLMDHLTKEQRHKNMAANKCEGTKIELLDSVFLGKTIYDIKKLLYMVR